MTGAAIDGTSVPRARQDVVAVTLDGEAVLHRAGRVHTLDPVATLVWRCCDGEATVDQIVDELAEVFALPSSTVRRDVATVIEELTALELVTANGVDPEVLDPEAPADLEVTGPELLADPPGSCASCAERVWLMRSTFAVGDHLVAVGGDSEHFDAATRAALAAHLVDPPAGSVAVPPFFGITAPEPATAAPSAGGPQPLHLLHRGDLVVARSRRPDRVLTALVGHLATYGDLATLGLATVRGVVVAVGDRAMIVPEPADPIRFRRELAGQGVLVADLPVAIVDPVPGEVVVGAPGLTVDPAPIDALASESPDGGEGAEPAPLPWGRYRVVALGVAGPASRAAALLSLGPARGDHRDPDATFAALLALLDAVPVVEAADASAIGGFLLGGGAPAYAPAVRSSTVRNIARNALRPHYLPVMARKVAARLRPSHHDAAVRWAGERAESLAELGAALDPDLWAESEAWAAEFRVAARRKLDTLAVPLGGGGQFQLVYFLVRYLRPRVVLETGVAAGWTSQAILTALERNGGEGTLYSSDFPYFRLDEPERYVGCLVDDALKSRWHLALNGDRANLAEFGPALGEIDFVHYDSDKSVEGRQFVMDTIAGRLGPGAVVVMDDIDDNTFFRDWLARTGRRGRVFARGRKYVGLTGL